MTVRWKPLLILSGLFVAVAVVGVIAISSTLAPPSSQALLKQARAAREAGRLADAEIHFKQALQAGGADAAVHDEFATLYELMLADAPDGRKEALRAERVDHLLKARKLDPNMKGPRLRLLHDAMADDVATDAVAWAREVAAIDPDDLDAAFVLAFRELESGAPNLADARKRLDQLKAGDAPEIRRLLIQARLAAATNDEAARAEALAAGRVLALADDAGPTDMMAKLRICALAAEAEADLAAQAEIVKEMVALSDRVVASAEPGSQRVTRLLYLLEQSQRGLIQQSRARGLPAADALVEAIEAQLAGLYDKARQIGDRADFQIHLTYSDHLRFRRLRDRCLQVVKEALASPPAARPSSSLIALGLHTVGAEVALMEADDPDRAAKAAPHIQALLAAADDRYQGLGHLFQGALELEESGVSATVSKKPGADAKAQPKLRASALAHLKAAAQKLPEVAEAQARYGVALVLNQEQALGRQYLQNALRMSALDPQYEFWAAWTMVQAGYPEEALPIVESISRQLDQGSVPPEMRGVLRQLAGEVYQARGGPGDLDRAAREFEQVVRDGDRSGGGAALRLAQIDMQRGRLDEAFARVDALRKAGDAPPAAENLAVLILERQGKAEEARATLAAARAKFPDASEIAGLDAALKVRDKKAAEAEALLAEFLAAHPDDATLAALRAQILADELDRVDDARKLLAEVGERGNTSAPWVQLAQLEMGRDDLEAAAAVIAKVRARWKEGAAADVLDGQLALKRKDVPAAIAHFDEALRKDPENKVVAFWKAQLDGAAGDLAGASRALNDIVQQQPSKEVDGGVTLLRAAQSALASLSLQAGDADDAIRRFEELKRGDEAGSLTRDDRWRLVRAYVAKDQWPAAKAEMTALFNDPAHPASPDDLVRAANLYREQDEIPAAVALLDRVLKTNPGNASAVVTRALLHMNAKEYPAATALLRSGLEATAKEEGGQSPEIFFLMLAAVEYETPPAASSADRTVKVVDEGLAAVPDSIPLVQAKYLILDKGGESAKALAFVESRAQDDPTGTFRRLLVDVYRHQKNYEGAEKLLRGLTADNPTDGNLAAALVEVVSLAASDALADGDADKLRALEDSAESLIREYRDKFPANLAILQAECDQAARRGDHARAVEITREVDKVAKHSAVGPLLRARLFASRNQPHDVAAAYAEAVEREPRRLDVRLSLGKAALRLGDVDAALAQAEHVLEAKKGDRDANLLRAAALDASGVGDAQREAARAKAVTQLEAAVAADPKFVDALETIADIELKRDRRPAALAALKRALAAEPGNPAALARYAQLLAEPDPAASSANPAGLEEVKRLASEVVARDPKGAEVLAVAVGLHKARRHDLALPLSEKAAALLDSPVAHLNLGDLLLAVAEGQPDAEKARPYFERAVKSYDRVLELQPLAIEAVNNKAWVLHSSLGRSAEAMELIDSILPRVNAALLPGEFYDTVGAVQEALGKPADAELSYLEGLKRSPDLAVLHYHYGKLIASDKERGDRAREHLEKAAAARDQLSPAMVDDAVRLVAGIEDDSR